MRHIATTTQRTVENTAKPSHSGSSSARESVRVCRCLCARALSCAVRRNEGASSHSLSVSVSVSFRHSAAQQPAAATHTRRNAQLGPAQRRHRSGAADSRRWGPAHAAMSWAVDVNACETLCCGWARGRRRQDGHVLSIFFDMVAGGRLGPNLTHCTCGNLHGHFPETARDSRASFFHSSLSSCFGGGAVLGPFSTP